MSYPRCAIVLAALFLLGLGLVCLSVTVKKPLETVSSNAAVADRAFYEGDVTLDQALVNWRGAALYPAAVAPLKLNDSDMRAAGAEDTGKFQLYRHAKHGETLFIKTKVNRYIPLRTGSPNPAAPQNPAP